MAKMVTLSFKDTEIDLYKYIKSKSSPSAYIKDLIEKEMGGVILKVKEKKDEEPKKSPTVNVSALKGVGK